MERRHLSENGTPKEKRFFPLEIRQTPEAPGHLVGHAAVFNRIAPAYLGWEEQVAPGAFTESIKTDDIRALFNHDPNFILGRNVSNTLTLYEDQRGLAFDIVLPDSQTVRDLVMTPILRGDLSQCSFSFSVVAESWDYQGDTPLRTIAKVSLYDIGPVTFPWYTDTDVSARAADKAREMRSSRDRSIVNGISSARRRRELMLLERELEG